MRSLAALLLLPGVLSLARADEKGTTQFIPGEQKHVPQQYQLDRHTFDWQLKHRYDLKDSGIRVHRLTFPSPIKSPHKENNTVHGEYFVPSGKGPFPAVIVLDVLGGDETLPRSQATMLAQKGVAALFVTMAYYGPRRPANSSVRLLSPDIEQTLAAIRQTVLDLRRATAWLASRPEVDRQRLGIMGTSLGSFLAGLTAEMEPRLRRVAILLGGGGLVEAYYDDPRGAEWRRQYEKAGGSRARAAETVACVDPLTCAGNLKDRKVLMIAARRDEIVPPRMAEALWKASGKQKIIWYDTTHYGAILYMLPAMKHIVEHFAS